MDSKLRCVFAMPAGQETNNLEEPKFDVKYENNRNTAAASPPVPAKVRNTSSN